MSGQNQDTTIYWTFHRSEHQEKYPPLYKYGQQQHQGDGQPPQGYSQPAGCQPVFQSYGQQGYQPQGYQPHQYGKQPAYGGQPQQHFIAEPVPNVIADYQPRPTNYLTPAILACLCCFWPTGICAIIAASNANSAADRGDMAHAEAKTITARNLLILTVVLGVIFLVFTIVVRVASAKS